MKGMTAKLVALRWQKLCLLDQVLCCRRAAQPYKYDISLLFRSLILNLARSECHVFLNRRLCVCVRACVRARARVCVCVCVCVATDQLKPWLPHFWGFCISRNYTHIHTVGLLCMSDRPVAETGTYKTHDKYTWDQHPCRQRDPNPHSQQLSICSPTP